MSEHPVGSENDEDTAQLPLGDAPPVVGFVKPNRTGFPPGNPNNVSATERETRKREIAELGAQEAAKRAWERAGAARAARGQGGGSSAKTTKGKAPKSPSDFEKVADLGEARSRAKGKDRKEIERWSKSVQFAHALLAMRIQDATWQVSDEEAVLLTEAVMDVLEHYNIKMRGTAGVWGALVYAVGMVYGPRAAGTIIKLVQQRRNTEAARGQQARPVQTGPHMGDAWPVQ